MGRINLNKLLYILRKNIKWVIPRKYRKPFYLFSSVIGLIFYFNFMLRLTASIYLQMIKKVVGESWEYLTTNFSPTLVNGLLVMIVILVVMRYLRAPAEGGKDGGKSNYNRSIYYQVNGLISFAYAGVTLLAFLPFILQFIQFN